MNVRPAPRLILIGLSLVALPLLLAGCGNKGPLILAPKSIPVDPSTLPPPTSQSVPAPTSDATSDDTSDVDAEPDPDADAEADSDAETDTPLKKDTVPPPANDGDG